MAFCAFLDYPLLASQLIFEDIDPGQLFELARLSKRTELKIKNSGVRCKKHSVSFTGNPSVCLHFKSGKQLEFIFNRPFPKDSVIKSGHFNDFGFTYAKISENLFYVCPADVSTFRGVYLFYDYIVGIFSTQLIGHFNVDVDKIKNLIGLLSIPELNRCEVLHLIGEQMEDEDAEYIQNNCEVKDTLVLTGNVGKREQHTKMYEVKNLIVKSNTWINSEDLIRMNCENIFIKDSKITDVKLIEFVRSWRNGNSNSRLKTIEVHFCGTPFLTSLRLLPVPDGPDDGEFSDLEMQYLKMKMESVLRRNDERIHREERKTVWTSLGRHKLDWYKHGKFYSRGEPTFSSLMEDSDDINLDSYYRDIKRDDGIIASISIHENVFKMIVWEEIEDVPIEE